MSKTNLTDASGNPKQVFGIVNYLLANEVKHKYPVNDCNEHLAENFAQFFTSKILTIKNQISESCACGTDIPGAGTSTAF